VDADSYRWSRVSRAFAAKNTCSGYKEEACYQRPTHRYREVRDRHTTTAFYCDICTRMMKVVLWCALPEKKDAVAERVARVASLKADREAAAATKKRKKEQVGPNDLTPHGLGDILLP